MIFLEPIIKIQTIMKRRITALMSLLLITSCNAKKTHDTTPKRQGCEEWELGGNLYGDVDSVTITNYKLTDKFGELVIDGIIDTLKLYHIYVNFANF